MSADYTLILPNANQFRATKLMRSPIKFQKVLPYAFAVKVYHTTLRVFNTLGLHTGERITCKGETLHHLTLITPERKRLLVGTTGGYMMYGPLMLA